MILWVLSSDRWFRDRLAAELPKKAFTLVEFVSLCHYKEKAAKEEKPPNAVVVCDDLKETVALPDQFSKSVGKMKIPPNEPQPCFIRAVEEIRSKYDSCEIFVLFGKRPANKTLEILADKNINPITTNQLQHETIRTLRTNLSSMEET